MQGEPRKYSIISDNDGFESRHDVSDARSRSPPKASESEQSLGHVTKTITPRPLQPVPVVRSLPAVLSSEQSRSTEKDATAPSLQRYPFRDASSTIVAQAAVRNTVALGLSGVPEPLRAEGDVPISNGDPSTNPDHGLGSNAPRRGRRNDVTVGAGLDDSKSDEAHHTTDGDDFSGRRSRRRSASKPQPYARTPSAHSRPRVSSNSNAHDIDERTGLTEIALADAIVASSLASSRAPSPTKQVPAPPPPRRSSVSRSLFRRHHSSGTDLSRHESPYKGMRQTLRKYDSDDEDEDENT
jgi:hypothetical protein